MSDPIGRLLPAAMGTLARRLGQSGRVVARCRRCGIAGAGHVAPCCGSRYCVPCLGAMLTPAGGAAYRAVCAACRAHTTYDLS